MLVTLGQLPDVIDAILHVPFALKITHVLFYAFVPGRRAAIWQRALTVGYLAEHTDFTAELERTLLAWETKHA